MATNDTLICRSEFEKGIDIFRMEQERSIALHPGARLYSFLEQDEHENKVTEAGWSGSHRLLLPIEP